MYFFKLHHEVIYDVKLRRFSVHQKWAWIVLLCLASMSNCRGTIYLGDDDLADLCEFLQLEDFLFFKDRLRQKGMIEPAIDGRGIKILNWEERQSADYRKPSDSPEATRRRKQRQRDRENQEKESRDSHALSRDGHGLSRPERDLDLEREQEEDLERERSVPPGRKTGDSTAVRNIFETWRKLWDKSNRIRLTPEKTRAIAHALETYTEQECLEAIEGFLYDPWPERKLPANSGLEVLLRTGQRGTRNNVEAGLGFFQNRETLQKLRSEQQARLEVEQSRQQQILEAEQNRLERERFVHAEREWYLSELRGRNDETD
jgi:hypothetical protein